MELNKMENTDFLYVFVESIRGFGGIFIVLLKMNQEVQNGFDYNKR